MLSPTNSSSLYAEVSPMAYDLLGKSLHPGEEDTDVLSFSLETHILEKIATFDKNGISGYIEKKVGEYVQAILFGTIVGILNDVPVQIQMEYFRRDIIDGRDAIVQFGDDEWVAIDVTTPQQVDKKIQKNNDVDRIVEKANQGQEKTRFVQEELGKLIVGIPYALTLMVSRQLDTESAIDIQGVQRIILDIISNQRYDRYLDEIVIAGANIEGRRKAYELFGNK